MRFWWVLLAFAMSHAAAGEPDWPQLDGGATHDNWRDRVDTVRWPRVRWDVPGAGGQPTILSGVIYCGGQRLLRIDPERGEVLAAWSPGKDEGRVLGGVALGGDTVVARLYGGTVVALDSELQTVRWRRPTATRNPTKFSFYPGARAAGLYVVGDAHTVFALRVKDGTVAWSHRLNPGELVEMTPAIDGNRVLFGTTQGRFLALDLKTGSVAWARFIRSTMKWTDPVVAFDRVIIADRGGGLHAFDPETGERLWRGSFFAVGFELGVGRDALIGGFADRLALFDPKTGAQLEAPRIQTGLNSFGSPTQIGETLYAGCLDGSLSAFDRKTGERRWAFRIRSETTTDRAAALPQVHDFVWWKDRLYVSSNKGLLCLEQDPTKNGAPPRDFVLEWYAR